MNAKKCDRCGKFYETGGNTSLIQCDSEYVGVLLYSDIYPKKANNTIHDLCNDCAEEFQKWMNQGANGTE